MSDAPPTRASLEAALAEEEARLRALDVERAHVAARAEALRVKLVALLAAPPVAPQPLSDDDADRARRSPAEKVKLFRQFFRGRDDVYPTRFVSKKTGNAGYAPACANKFVVGVCPLPKVKCGDCTNQAFRPVDDRAVREHLQGKHVMGIYPMLPDETCWFLAVDFDKSTWKEDARAFAETARRLGLPVLVERSRSGNGAHVWFFFSEPVPAAIARRMGCHVITETMAARHELSMDRTSASRPRLRRDAKFRVLQPEPCCAHERAAKRTRTRSSRRPSPIHTSTPNVSAKQIGKAPS